LYAGLRPTLFAVVPNAAVYLSAYDEISSRLRREARRRDDDDGRASSGDDDGRRDGDRGGRHWIPFVAGASARLVSSVATGEFSLYIYRFSHAYLLPPRPRRVCGMHFYGRTRFLYRFVLAPHFPGNEQPRLSSYAPGRPPTVPATTTTTAAAAATASLENSDSS
jgi:hypothetical protein